MEIIIPPKGMRYDLARQLVHNNSFAHMWLCHGGDATKCPDGCAGEATCEGVGERTKLYEGIRVYHTREDVEAYKRGYADCDQNRPQLWVRKVGGRIVAHNCSSEWDEDMSDNWSESAKEAYCDGHDARGRQPA